MDNLLLIKSSSCSIIPHLNTKTNLKVLEPSNMRLGFFPVCRAAPYSWNWKTQQGWLLRPSAGGTEW